MKSKIDAIRAMLLVAAVVLSGIAPAMLTVYPALAQPAATPVAEPTEDVSTPTQEPTEPAEEPTAVPTEPVGSPSKSDDSGMGIQAEEPNYFDSYEAPDASVPVNWEEPFNIRMTVSSDQPMAATSAVLLNEGGSYSGRKYWDGPLVPAGNIVGYSLTIPQDYIRGVCTSGGFSLQLLWKVSSEGTAPIDLEMATWQYTCAERPPLLEVVPTGELDIVEVCGPDEQAIQQNDLVTLRPQDGVVLNSAAWQGSDYVLVVTPRDGYYFPGVLEMEFRYTDTGTICGPLVVSAELDSDALVDVSFPDQVELPFSVKLPASNPFNLVSTTFRIGNGEDREDNRNSERGANDVELSGFVYQIPSEFAAMCEAGNGSIDMTVSVTASGPNGATGQVSETFSLQCAARDESVLVTPAENLTVTEICGTDELGFQANDFVDLEPQDGIVVQSAEWNSGIFEIIVVPAQGFRFPDDQESVTFRHSDTNTICGDIQIDLDADSEVLVNAASGDTVSLPVTITLPPNHPFDWLEGQFSVASFDGDRFDQGMLPGGANDTFGPFDFVIPANFAEVCEQTNGAMSLSVWVKLYGSNGGEVNAIVADQNAEVRLPCNDDSSLETVTPALNAIVQISECGPENDTFSTSQQGVELSVSAWANNSATVTLTPATGYTFPDGAVTSKTVTDANLSCTAAKLSLDVDDTTFILIDPPSSITINAEASNQIPGLMILPGMSSLTLDGIYTNEAQSNDNGDGTYTIVFNVPVDDALIAACNSDNALTLSSTAVFIPGGPITSAVSVPCSITRAISPDLVPPAVAQICGAQNDEVTPAATQPAGVDPVPDVSEWDGNTITLTYKPAAGYQFADGFDPVIVVTDEAVTCPEFSYSWDPDGLASVVPGEPVYLLVDITLPEGHGYDTYSVELYIESPGYHAISDDLALEPGVSHQQVRVLWPANDQWPYVCGRSNRYAIQSNVLSEADPTLEMIEKHHNGSMNCTLAEPFAPEFDAIEQTAICGPNNDTFTTSQENVELSHGDWDENTIDLTITPAPNYYFQNGEVTTREFTDANEPCPPSTRTITVSFEPSDGGSLAGTPYRLFAPVASMQQQPAFAEGVIRVDNTITIDGLVAGSYRLVTAPRGYDPIDMMLDVVEGDDPQMFTVQVAAVQIPVTPTPTPTPEPTVPPTVEPTAEPTETVSPTVEPTGTASPTTVPGVTPNPGSTGTQEAAATTTPGESPTSVAGVSGLPNTGAGGSQGTLLIGILGAAESLLLCATRLRSVGR